MEQILRANARWIDETWEKIHRKLSKVCIRSREKLPFTSVNGVHDDHSHILNDWTNGFWPGMMWLMYVGTGYEEYRKTAERAELLMDPVLEDYKSLHHDVGFMWIPASVANYRITGNKAAGNKSLFLASTLFSRYNIDGRYIRAWNNWCDTAFDLDKTRTIVDCMMNIPLLYWASEELKDERFTRVAMAHADTTMRDHIREDGSIIHVVTHDIQTGQSVKLGFFPGGGYNEDTSWSRGVAWAIYGFVISYMHTKAQRYLDTAILCADHFIRESKKTGYIPLADFYAPKAYHCLDASSAMTAVCGIIEIAKALGGDRGNYYMGEAMKILRATEAYACNYTDDEDALVTKATGFCPRPGRPGTEIEIPLIFADFFFVEAMLKLKGNTFQMW